MSSFRVSQLGAHAGVSADTIRYYDRLGLLPPPERSESGYRLYDERAVERLRMIKNAQSIGLRLNEIGELLATLDGGECPCDQTVEAMTSRREEIDLEILRLQALRDQLDAAITRSVGADCCEPQESGPCVPDALRPREEVTS